MLCMLALRMRSVHMCHTRRHSPYMCSSRMRAVTLLGGCKRIRRFSSGSHPLSGNEMHLGSKSESSPVLGKDACKLSLHAAKLGCLSHAPNGPNDIAFMTPAGCLPIGFACCCPSAQLSTSLRAMVECMRG